MQTEPVYIELPRLFVNQSRMKVFADCNRLYGWQHVENLVPSRPRIPLVLGTAIHKAQVLIHEKGATPEAIEEGVKLAGDFFVKEATPKGPQLPGDADEVAAGADMVKSLLRAYYDYWRGMGQLWKPLGQEVSFCVEVGEGTNVYLVGTIDNLGVYMGNLWLVDYKTMGKMDMRDFIKYELDLQLTAYIYGGTKQLSLDARKEGRPPVVIRGAIIDGMIKTKPPKFHREMYTRSIDDLREFESEFCMKAWEIGAKSAMARGDRKSYDAFSQRMWDLGNGDWKVAFPMNTQHCFRYGTCSHRDLCVKDTPERRMSYVNRTPDYVDNAAAKVEP